MIALIAFQFTLNHTIRFTHLRIDGNRRTATHCNVSFRRHTHASFSKKKHQTNTLVHLPEKTTTRTHTETRANDTQKPSRRHHTYTHMHTREQAEQGVRSPLREEICGKSAEICVMRCDVMCGVCVGGSWWCSGGLVQRNSRRRRFGVMLRRSPLLRVSHVLVFVLSLMSVFVGLGSHEFVSVRAFTLPPVWSTPAPLAQPVVEFSWVNFTFVSVQQRIRYFGPSSSGGAWTQTIVSGVKIDPSGNLYLSTPRWKVLGVVFLFLFV